jgi:hypothetical protein
MGRVPQPPPAAGARGKAPQVCMLKIAAILAFTHFLLSSVAGSRSGFKGQLWLPFFLEPSSRGGQSGAQDDYFSYIKIKRCQCRAIETADDRYR